MKLRNHTAKRSRSRQRGTRGLTVSDKSHPIAQQIETTIDKSRETRGYRIVEPEQADTRVTLFVTRQNRADASHDPQERACGAIPRRLLPR